MFNVGMPAKAPMLLEADFYIHELHPVNFFGNTVHITTTHVCTVIVILALMILTLCLRHAFFKAEREGKMTAASTIVEMGVDALTHFVEDSLGKKNAKPYINYIGVLFLYIFFSVAATSPAVLCLAFMKGAYPRSHM